MKTVTTKVYMKEGMENIKHRGKEEKITRKQAIKKVGYTAFTAATMMLLLNDPAKGQQLQSDTQDSPAPLDPFDEW